MILYGRSGDVADFVARLLGFERGFGECQAIGFLAADGTLEAGVVFHNWNPEAATIEISAASVSRRWATPDRWAAVAHYAYETCGCRMMVARTSERNPRALNVWRKLGANEYRIPGLRGPDEAEIVTTLTVEQWRDKWARR